MRANNKRNGRSVAIRGESGSYNAATSLYWRCQECSYPG